MWHAVHVTAQRLREGEEPAQRLREGEEQRREDQGEGWRGPGRSLVEAVEHLACLAPVVLTSDVWSDFSVHLLRELVHAGASAISGFRLSAENDLVLDLLNSGLEVAYFALETDGIDLQQFCSSIPRQRLGLVLAAADAGLPSIVSRYRSIVGHFCLELDELAAADLAATQQLVKTLLTATADSVQIIVKFPANNDCTAEVVKSWVSLDERCCLALPPRLHAERAAQVPSLQPWTASAACRCDLIDAFLATLRTDRPDGLYTTVVCDEHQHCLGLVYSNETSIERSFLARQGVYHSRSRGGLWHKGASSGMTQELLRIRLDCDRDALRFTVCQHGQPPAFCHLNTRSCWGEATGVKKLELTLQQRQTSAPEGSYTQKLFRDSDLLRQKLLEEVQELVEATEHDHIAAEAADVMYFLMTRCVGAGVSLRDIERHLDLRALKIQRRPGLAKTWRTADAELVLRGTAPGKPDAAATAAQL